MLIMILQCFRSESDSFNLKFAEENAEVLYVEGSTRLGMNEQVLCAIFATESFAVLRRIFDEYQKRSGTTMHQAIRYSMDGKLAQAMLAIGGY